MLLVQRKEAYYLEMKEKYNTIIDRYRKKFIKGYLEVFKPSKQDIEQIEKKELRKESNKIFHEIIKQKIKRIGINVKQAIGEKCRD